MTPDEQWKKLELGPISVTQPPAVGADQRASQRPARGLSLSCARTCITTRRRCSSKRCRSTGRSVEALLLIGSADVVWQRITIRGRSQVDGSDRNRLSSRVTEA